MFVRNLLQSGREISLQGGEYVTLVPFGLPITIQYSDKGLIQKVMLNHDKDSWEDVTQSFLPLILKNHQVPNKISITGGSSYVRGAFVTLKVADSLRKHPTSLHDEFKQMYVADPLSFTFYAGDVQSLATAFKGAVATRQWLSASKFTLLPGYVVPRDLTEERFRTMITQNYPFTYPLIESYILYHQDYSITYPTIQLRQDVIKQTLQTFTEVGDIIGIVTYEDGQTQKVPYSTIVKFNLQANSLVIRNSEDSIIHSISSSENAKKKNVVSNRLQCRCCGRQIVIPSTGNVRCPDPQCNSVLYPRVLQLVTSLKLPPITFESYLRYSDEIGSIFSVLDIFDLGSYKTHELNITLAEGLRAIVPKTILPGMSQINQICDYCNNSAQTLQYYLQHIDRMKMEFDLDEHAFGRFFDWIEDTENCSDVIEFFKLNNVNITKATKKFEGAPIFRDKLILLTGSFIHGSLDEIANILHSYSAETTTQMSDNVNCVVIGDGQENINGHAVIEARKKRVPVMSESEFFMQYDIDTDLAENL